MKRFAPGYAVKHCSLLLLGLICGLQNAWSQPVITAFSPASGTVGTPVTIAGNNFSAVLSENIVYFGAVRATVTAASPGSLTVSAPAGATHQPITVTVNGRTAYSTQPFITSFAGADMVVQPTSFGMRRDYEGDYYPRGIGTSDLDGDGKPDLFVGNYTTSSISVRRNMSTTDSVLFGPAVNIPSGTRPYFVEAGDLDGDGKPEIAAVHLDAHTVSVWRNISTPGQIAFATRMDFQTLAQPTSVAISDIDGDGRPDLIVSHANDTATYVSVFRNTTASGNINFAAKKDFRVYGNSHRVTAGDFNGDRKPELAVVGLNNDSVTVFHNFSVAGNIGFAPVSYYTGDQPRCVALGDLDGDGRLDMAVVNTLSSTLSLFRNTSSNGFISFAQTEHPVAQGRTAYSVAIGDMSGDGKPDLLVSTDSSFTSKLCIFTNTGTAGLIAFTGRAEIPSTPEAHCLLIADFNLDSKPDLAAGSFGRKFFTVHQNIINNPFVDRFTPATGTNGTVVTIKGKLFTGATGVAFGNVPAAAFTVVNDTVITATVGTGASGDVQVSSPTGKGSKPGFSYQHLPVINSFFPPVAGPGELVSIKGQHFVGTSAVYFGGAAASWFNVESDTLISARVDMGATGPVSVTTPGGTAEKAGFTFIPRPIIYTFSPSAAAMDDTVTITGKFFTNTTNVQFGSVPAAAFTVISDTMILAKVSHGSSGSVSVFSGKGAAQLPGFVYTGPIVTAFNPVAGGTGTSVTIRGSNFTGVTAVHFGNSAAASFIIKSDKEIIAVVGQGAGGSVSVTSPNGLGLLGSFIFHASRPVIASVSPLSGSPETSVTITGSGFDPVAGNNIVYFGATQATVIAATTNQLVVQAPKAGTYGWLTVTANGLTAYASRQFVTTFKANATNISATSFGPPINFPATHGSNDVRISDFDNDGKPDLAFAITALQDGISIYRNTSSGGATTFSPQVSFPANEKPGGEFELGDFDGDGRVDIVTINGANAQIKKFYVLRNASVQGTISFDQRTDHTAHNFPARVYVADIDGDGKPDVITQSDVNTLCIATNTSTGGVISFHTADTISFENYITGIAFGDIDQDGRTDLVVANSDLNSISVLRNLSTPGNIAFAPKRNFQNVPSPVNIAVGDLDNDGKPDLAISQANLAKPLSVLRNATVNTNITFEPAHQYGTPGGDGNSAVLITDINGDGKADVCVGNYLLNRVSIFQNNSANSALAFSSPAYLTSTNNIYLRLAAGDLNGDASPELVIPSQATHPVTVFRNKLADSIARIMSFAPATGKGGDTIAIHGAFLAGATKVLFGDIPAASFVVESDSLIKAIIGEGTSGTISVITPQAVATRNGFTYSGPIVRYFSPAFGGQSTLVTITGDRFTGATQVRFGDVAAASFTVVSDTVIKAVVDTGATGPLRVSTPAGTIRAGTFTFRVQPVITGFHPEAAPAGATVTITGANFDPSPAGNIVYFGAVKATIVSATSTQLVVTVPAGATYEPIYVTTNALTGSSAKQFRLTFAGGDIAFTPGFFARRTELPAGQRPSTIRLSDMDSDGRADIISVNRTVEENRFRMFRNTSAPGSVSFDSAKEYITNKYTSHLAVRDLDGDGRPDLAVTRTDVLGLAIYRNISEPGNLELDSAVHYATGSVLYDVQIEDLNMDGQPDIVVVCRQEEMISVYRNTSTPGNISFAAKVDFRTTPYPGYIACSDMNGDGKIDMVLSESEYNLNSIAVYLNTGTKDLISFANAVHFPVGGSSPLGIAIGDLNDDDKPDVVTANSRSISVLQNTSQGHNLAFQPSELALSGYSDATNVILNDLNGDGRCDILFTRNSTGAISVHKNISTGSTAQFAPRVDYASGATTSDVAAGDLDGDGRPDMVATNFGGHTISVFRNSSSEATLNPSGANPVTGPVSTTITIDTTVQTVNGTPYVRRHYDIEPANNPATATATVTLYFTQEDFDLFNAHPDHGPDLPKYPGDATGKANLRIYQYHGFSATGQPGSYSDTVEVINPDDHLISWNDAAACWEVTFDVVGFSGFFVSTVGFAWKKIEAPTIHVTGDLLFCEGGKVLLTSSAPANNQWYRDGIAVSGATGNSHEATTSGTYTVRYVQDEITSPHSKGQVVETKPVPSKPVISRNGADLVSNAPAGNQWYQDNIAIPDATESTYRPASSGNYSVRVTVSGCTSEMSEPFQFVTTGVIVIDATQYIKLAPNPVRNELLLDFRINGQPNLNIQLIDMKGRIVGNFMNLANSARLRLTGLNPGIYIARVFTNNRKINYSLQLWKQ